MIWVSMKIILSCCIQIQLGKQNRNQHLEEFPGSLHHVHVPFTGVQRIPLVVARHLLNREHGQIQMVKTERNWRKGETKLHMYIKGEQKRTKTYGKSSV